MRTLPLSRALQQLDRRIIYVALALVLAVPFVVDYHMPIWADAYTRRLYATIEELAADPVRRDQVVLLLTNWGPGSEGENGPQLQALVQHLLRRRVRFVMVSTAPDPVPIAVAEARLARALQAERSRAARRGEPVPTWVYGDDYMNWGFRPATVFEPIAKTLVRETRAFYQRDYVTKEPLDEERFPLLRHFRGPGDIALLLAVTPGDEPKTLCGIVQRQMPELRIAVATMGVAANDLYPYVKSGQICGLLNSARAAAEYFSLLDPERPVTTPADNSMSLGKLFLLLLVVVGNVAFLVARRAERQGLLPARPAANQPQRPLPAGLLWAGFAGLVVLFAGTAAVELYTSAQRGAVVRVRVPRAADNPLQSYPRYEHVAPVDLAAELPLLPHDDDDARAQRAHTAFARLVELRVGEFLAALLTLGIFAFLLGDNTVYRVTEAFMIGGALGFLIPETWDKVLAPMLVQPVLHGLAAWQAAAPDPARWQVLWALMLVPGALWFFVYSRKYRWLNQLVIAAFLGCAIGPEFGKQAGIMVPQILDTLRPVWPTTIVSPSGATVIDWAPLEHLVFVVVLVLSLLYFVFFLRPKTRVGRGAVTAGRLVMMIGFGAMFGNTVNTRMSWLAPRIGYLVEDWLGKLLAP